MICVLILTLLPLWYGLAQLLKVLVGKSHHLDVSVPAVLMHVTPLAPADVWCDGDGPNYVAHHEEHAGAHYDGQGHEAVVMA